MSRHHPNPKSPRIWRLIVPALLLLVVCMQAPAQDAGPVLIKEVATREVTLHVGGVQANAPREVITRELTLSVQSAGPGDSPSVASREVSLAVTDAAPPPPVTELVLEVSPTGDRVTLDWSGYNQWAVGDIARFDIHITDDGPLTDVTGRSPDLVVGGDGTSLTITDLAEFTDHYVAIVPVDALGNSDPAAVIYSAAYILAPQAISRELTLHVGGAPQSEPKQVISREASLVVVSDTPPPAIENLSVSVTPTGAVATLDWSSYNPWSVADVDHFAIYQSDTGPIFDVTGLTPVARVSAELLGWTLTGLTPFVEHYFAVVPVDGLGQFEPLVSYGAGYVLSPQAISREVTLFTGGVGASPYPQAISREVSLVTTDDAAPAPVTGIDSGFNVETSRGAYGSVILDWTEYDEVAQRDVATYRIYTATEFYEDVSGLIPFATVPAGKQTHLLGGLPGGAILYFAVVAEDAAGNFDPTVRAFSQKVSIAGVGEVLDLTVASGADSLTFSWAPPEDAEDFLTGYRLYFAGSETPIDLPPETTTWQRDGLAAATGYPLRITTLDVFGDESDGTSVLGVTWLPNPTGLSLRGIGDQVELSWVRPQPAGLVAHYAVYSATAPITSISGLVPVTTRTGTSAMLGSFNAIRERYYAVATVNLSGGTDPAVTSVFAGNYEDLTPPVIESVSFAGQVLVDGAVLTRPDVLSVAASDPAGIARVDFSLDGALFNVDADAGNGLGIPWDIAALADGGYRLSVLAVDAYGNRAGRDLDINIDLAPPPAPVITEPPGDGDTNEPLVRIRGTTSADAQQVTLYRNGAPVGSPVPASYGEFQAQLELEKGANVITARAENRGGLSEPGNPRSITLDLSIPDAPVGLSARAREGGVVQLSWAASADATVTQYGIYRQPDPFDVDDVVTPEFYADQGNAAYSDTPPADGPWYYRVSAIDRFGTESALSNQAQASADSVAPQALSIDYAPLGAYDPERNAFGVGDVEVRVQLSEAVSTTPFLTIAPSAGVPQPVALTWLDDTAYMGRFSIGDGTPSGDALAVFSARDNAGNRGTDILAGASLLIDTDGPSAGGFSVTPADPVLNNPEDPATLDISFTPSEDLADSTEPNLSASAPSLAETPVVIALTEQDGTWTGQLPLPAEMGADGPELLSFSFQGQDRLGNLGTGIDGPASIQVYQGELPPPETPAGLTATALPGGEVRLAWAAVDDATDYELHRGSGEAGELAAIARSAGALEFTDQPGADGIYRYAVASVRQANGQEGVSALSGPVAVKADATPPDAPSDLTLALRATGVEVSWNAPDDADPLTYRLYALPGAGLGALNPDAPTLSDITETSAEDPAPPAPEGDLLTYLVVAVDPAGNVSPDTAWDTLNAELLPVASFRVEQHDSDFPELAWSHVNAVDGFDLYLGSLDTGLKLNGSTPLTDTAYTDLGWSSGARTYSLLAVDDEGNESLPRTLTLLALEPSLAEATAIRRGLMNRVAVDIANTGSEPAQAVVLELAIGDHTHRSAAEDIPAGESRTLSTVVGGYADLPDLSTLAIAAVQTPNPGEEARVVRTTEVEVSDGVLLLELSARNLTRGGVGELRFSVENISPDDSKGAPVQLITATARGNQPSDEVRVRLTDLDGNPLASTALEQSVHPFITTLADGRCVATLPPGERFESDWLALDIPEAAPDQVLALLEIDQLHYRLGEDDAVSIDGLGTQIEAELADTPYVGEFLSVSPEQSLGDAPITIQGRALDRYSGEPVPRVELHLVIANGGFERVFEMFTGDDGAFSFDYQPLSTDAGVFQVSVVHPDLRLRPEQGGFSIGRVFVEPTRLRVQLGRDAERTLSLDVTAGDGFPVTNLRFGYVADDQLFGTLEPGLNLVPGAATALAAGEQGTLAVAITATEEALDSGSLILRLLADEGGDAPLGLVRIDYEVVEAGAVLLPSRSYLELVAAPGERASAELDLRNQGLRAVEGVTVALLDAITKQPLDWASLTTPAEIGRLEIGAEHPVGVRIAPTEAIPEDTHELLLRVAADNAEGFDIPVYAHVTRAGIGDVLFHVSDIYTATLDENGVPIPGLENARIEVQHEQFTDIQYNGRTDANGELLLTDLQAGRYLFRVSAANHADAQGRLTIEPGITASREVFLDYDLISLEWSVTEITIEDRYEITLDITYETDVPAPVVVIEPPGITLPEMAPGQVYRGELTITNYGLIRADNVVFTPPADDQFFDYEFQAEVPDSLEAKQRITVPYRIVALRPLNAGDDAEATGGAGGCGFGVLLRLIYDFLCINGVESSGSATFRISADVSASCTGGGWWGRLPGGIGGGGWTPVAWPLIPCPPDCEGDCCDRNGSGGGSGGGGGGGE
jgi:hypothetical protein